MPLPDKLWKESASLFSGTHHLTEDAKYPFDSIHEIIPGLFLSCESRVADKSKAMRDGIALIISLCATKSDSMYTVYHGESSGNFCCLEYDQSDFLLELNKYTSSSLPSMAEKLLFLCKIPADDVPTYNISQHFMECCYLIELCLCNRHGLDLQGKNNQENSRLPNVVVHCLAGVSRSASVVAAYLMKKFDLSAEEAVSFLKSVRQVVSPNVGFLQQLEDWKVCKYRLASDDWSAKQVGEELKACDNLLQECIDYITILLKKGKLREGRNTLCITMESAVSDHGRNASVQFGFTECFHIFNKCMKAELYVDTPDIFQYLCEIITSMQRYFIKLFYYHEKVEWNDRVFIPFLCSLLHHSSWRETDAINSNLSDGIQSFLANIHRIHCHGKPPFLLPGSAMNTASSRISSSLNFSEKELRGFCFSFPFLPSVVPIAVMEVAMANLLGNLNEKIAEDDRLVVNRNKLSKEKCITEVEKGKKNIAHSFPKQFHFLWREVAKFLIGLFDASSPLSLSCFKDDVEVITLKFLHEHLVRGCSEEDFSAFDQSVRALCAVTFLDCHEMVEHWEMLFEEMLVEKIYGAILAFRLLLEVCEEYSASWSSKDRETGSIRGQTRSVTSSLSFSLTDEVLSWETISNLFQRVRSAVITKGQGNESFEAEADSRKPEAASSSLQLTEPFKMIFLALQKKDCMRSTFPSKEFCSWEVLLSGTTDTCFA